MPKLAQNKWVTDDLHKRSLRQHFNPFKLNQSTNLQLKSRNLQKENFNWLITLSIEQFMIVKTMIK